MAILVGTVARVNPKSGVWEHKHGGSGWHWASAGHRDTGEIHKQFKADAPTFVDGTPDAIKPSYFKALNREPGFVSQSPAKVNEEKGIYVKAK